MSAAKHTPGPWAVFSAGVFALRPETRIERGAISNYRRMIVELDEGIEVCPHGEDCDGECMESENEANAHVIAAAPDLLDALKTVAFVLSGPLLLCRRCKEPVETHSPRLCEVAAAIAKAEGR